MHKNIFFFFQIFFGWRKQGIKILDLYFYGTFNWNGPALAQHKNGPALAQKL
jgi:hypothetical protein